jgi:hypothetical protein
MVVVWYCAEMLGRDLAITGSQRIHHMVIHLTDAEFQVLNLYSVKPFPFVSCRWIVRPTGTS